MSVPGPQKVAGAKRTLRDGTVCTRKRFGQAATCLTLFDCSAPMKCQLIMHSIGGALQPTAAAMAAAVELAARGNTGAKGGGATPHSDAQ